MKRALRYSALLFAALASGCMVGPDYKRPAMNLPASYPQAAPGDAAAMLQTNWWTLYQDPVLNELVAGALARNADVRLAIARIEEADANLREANAAFLPEIDFGTAGTQRQRISATKADPLPPGTPQVRNNVKLGLSTSFEIDFWGKLRRGIEALRAQSLSSRYAKDVVDLSLAGLTAQAYFSLRSLDAQVMVTRDTLISRNETLALVRARADAGAVSDLDLNQAVLSKSDAAAQLKELERQRSLVEHQLGTLAGKLDFALPAGDERQFRELPIPPVPPPGLPSTLLERRPDVRQAEQDLIANNAKVGVAKASMLPSISLTGLFGGESVALSTLLNNDGSRIWSVGFGLLQPIFDGGRLAARTQQAQARQRQSVAGYQKAVESAFREVADALTNATQSGATEQDLAERLDAARNTLRLARLRYNAGYSAFLEVLDAQRNANDAELAFLRNRQSRLAISVDLMKALGGGWSAEGVAAPR